MRKLSALLSFFLCFKIAFMTFEAITTELEKYGRPADQKTLIQQGASKAFFKV